MAIDILEAKAKTVHGYQHDVESLFYVLIWICTMQNGPCGELRDAGTFKYKRSVLSVWNGGLHCATVPFEVVAMAKSRSMGDPDKFKDDVLDCFAAYFEPVKECLEKMREILFPKKVTNEDVNLVQRTLNDRSGETRLKPDIVTFLNKFIPVPQPAIFFDKIRNVLNATIEDLRRNNHHIRQPRVTPDPASLGSFFILHPVSLGVVSATYANAYVNGVPPAQYKVELNSQGTGNPHLKRRSGSDVAKATSLSRKKTKTSKNSRGSYVHVDHPRTAPSGSSNSPSSFQFISCSNSSPSIASGSGPKSG